MTTSQYSLTIMPTRNETAFTLVWTRKERGRPDRVRTVVRGVLRHQVHSDEPRGVTADYQRALTYIGRLYAAHSAEPVRGPRGGFRGEDVPLPGLELPHYSYQDVEALLTADAPGDRI
jgi:hypothetical protein